MVPARAGVSKERVYLTELSKYLMHNPTVVKKFAKRQGLTRKVGLGTAYGGVEYVSPYGAQRIIAYIRALQGDAYLHGKQFHEFNQHERERATRAGGRSPRKLLPPADVAKV